MRRNIQHLTFNVQRQTLVRCVLIGCWKFNVQCSMFPLAIVFLAAALPLQGQTNALPTLLPPYGELPPTFWEAHTTAVINCGGLIFLAAFTIWMLLRPKPIRAASLGETAIRSLEQLRSHPEDGRLLSEVSQIMKRYVGSVFGFAGGEMTTAEFSAVLANHPECDAQFAATIANLLQRCDRDKFAVHTNAPPLNAASQALRLVQFSEQNRRQTWTGRISKS